MQFTPIDNPRVYEKVIQQIQDLIYSGKLKKGDRLPPEREITEQLQISRASLREAYSALELVGIIETRPREGTFIRKDRYSPLKPLALAFLLEEHFERDFLELRESLEVECARLAALRRSEQDLADLAACVAGFGEENDESVNKDKKFHRLIARASQNSLLNRLVDSISLVVDRHIEELRRDLFHDEEETQQLLKIHEGIFRAIEQGNPQKAVELMTAHYQFVRAKLEC